jgi:putative two-component system response regulator
MASLIGAEVGLDTKACDLIRRTAPLHDIGKISVADAVLPKPGRLTEDEHKVMQTHTIVGAQILGGSSHEILEVAATIARSQHERWDGRGYPDGTGGLEIPLNARIVAVADVFDMLTPDRPYKQAHPLEKAFQIVVADSGLHFDPAVVDALRVIYHRAGPDQILGLSDPIDPMRDINCAPTTT